MAFAGGVIARLLGRGAAETAAFAAGIAIGPTLAPEIEFLKNESWAAVTSKALDAGTAAEIAAEDVDRYPDMEQQAAYNGIAAQLFRDLYGVVLTAPGDGELLQMLRRATITEDDFAHGLRKGKRETRWDDAIRDLLHVYLSPDILAVMLQRNVIPNQGQLPGVELDTTGRVPRFPHVPIDAYAMAKTFGWSQDQLDAQTRIQGLPPGMDLVARLVFRDVLDRGDFNLAAEQSNRRVEWADFEFEGYREILTTHIAAELELRGYLTRAQRLDLTRQHGMTDANSDLLYNVLGRGLSLHAAFIGTRRGGTLNGPTDAIPEWALYQLQRGNLRPEVFNLAWAGRHTLPSAFVIRSLLTDGALSEADGETLFLHSGWPTDLAAKVAKHYAAKSGGSPDPLVSKADTQLWTALHRSYIAGDTDDAAATPILHELGATADGVPVILARWAAERALKSKKLTAAQVKKAVNDSATNAATGAAWTQADALAYLIEELHYNATDAASFLAI